MSGDEAFLLITSLAVALVTWFLWYRGLLGMPRLGTHAPPRRLLALAPAACAVVLYLVLRLAAAHDVRDSGTYLTLYMLFGAAWVGMGAHVVRLLGVSARDDVIERGNGAAAVAITGALLAITLCFAGGNIGDGPGWWVVLYSGLLATAALLALWLVLEKVTRVADQVAIERDRAAGLRLAGVLVACGLVLGRAVAGDWVSPAATLRDFGHVAWPVLPLLLFAVLVDRVTRITPDRSETSPIVQGAFPALAYIGLAALYVVNLGAPA